MAIPKSFFPGEPRGIGAEQLSARNATRINVLVASKRVGRVLTLSESVNNNIQALRELGSQVLVELKKGISEYSFTIDKVWVRGDAFDEFAQGSIFSLETIDEGGVTPSGAIIPAGASGQGASGAEALSIFNNCSVDTIQRTITAGQATVAFSVRIVTIGQPSTGVLAEGF